MNKLRFGFIGDNYLFTDTSVNICDIVTDIFDAKNVYEYTSDDSDLTTVSAFNDRLPEALNQNIDILFLCAGMWDCYLAGESNLNEGYTTVDHYTRAIIQACQARGIGVVYISYPRIDFTAIPWFSGVYSTFFAYGDILKNEYDNVSHASYWWVHNLAQDNYPQHYDSLYGFWFTDMGRKVAAERISHAALSLVQKRSNKRIPTYACIGDSWTDIGTCVDPLDHWTRQLGNALGAKCCCDAAVGGWTAQNLVDNHHTAYTDIDQITKVLSFYPDMIFMTITGNDTWQGYNSVTKSNMRTVLNRLKNGGIKKVVWGFYAQIGWSDIAPSMGRTAEQIQTAFTTLRTEMKSLVNTEFSDFVTFVDSSMDDNNMDFSLHPDRYANGTDPVHPHDFGWDYYVPHLVTGFQIVYNNLYSNLNDKNLNIGINTEWLGNEEIEYPYVSIGTQKFPFMNRIDRNFRHKELSTKKQLKFVFIGDAQFCTSQDSEVSVPAVVTDYWHANKVYEYTTNDSSFTSSQAIAKVNESLLSLPDILFLCVGAFDTFNQGEGNTSYTELETNLRTMLSACQSAGIRTILVGYPRGDCSAAPWYYSVLGNMDTLYQTIAADYSNTVFCSLWWIHSLYYGMSQNGPWPSPNFAGIFHTDTGKYIIADRISQSTVRFAESIWNEKLWTYACIGDSWTDIFSSPNPRGHWTRSVGDIIGAYCVSDAAYGGWTVQQLASSATSDFSNIDQITRVLAENPDFIFMTITANDTWTGYSAFTKEFSRSVLRRLKNAGVKHVVWGFYTQIDFSGTASMFNVNESDQIGWFTTLKTQIKNLCNEDEFKDFVIFVDSVWDDDNLKFSNHPEHYNNGTDSAHIYESGWKIYRRHILNAFNNVYRTLYLKNKA